MGSSHTRPSPARRGPLCGARAKGVQEGSGGSTEGSFDPRAHSVQLSAPRSSSASVVQRFSSPPTMIVYQDLVSGDELLSDSFTYKELFNGVLWEVEGKWVVKGALDVDALIGANASAEGGEEDVGVDDQAVKVVDIIDTFRLQMERHFAEQPAFDKKGFMGYMKKYLKTLTPLVAEDRQAQFKEDVQGAVKFLLPKLGDFQFFVGESMKDDSSLVFAYYKEGESNPTFLYFGDSLKEVKC